MLMKIDDYFIDFFLRFVKEEYFYIDTIKTVLNIKNLLFKTLKTFLCKFVSL